MLEQRKTYPRTHARHREFGPSAETIVMALYPRDAKPTTIREVSRGLTGFEAVSNAGCASSSSWR